MNCGIPGPSPHETLTLIPSASQPISLAAVSEPPRAGVDRSSVASWLIVAMITAVVTVVSAHQSLVRYREFRSGFAWDLAYYNQWYWALNFGDGRITVRPLARYAEEGPSVWKMNYLAPIRFALAPIYRLVPGPPTLLLIQNVVFWWVIPAAYTLVRSESGSRALAVSAAVLVPLTPLLWPLALNDFRELQLALPFVLWAVQGVRSRSARLAAVGIAGMIACRQEFALMAATFAFIPPRGPEPLSATLRWRHLIVFAGLFWLLFGFLGYLRLCGGTQRAVVLRSAVSGCEGCTFRRRCTRHWRRSRTVWAPGPSWPASRRGSRSWRCHGSGPRAAANGRSIRSRRATGTTCATFCR